LTFRVYLPFVILFFLFVSGCAQRESSVGAKAVVGQPTDSFVVISGTATLGGNWKPNFTNGRTYLTEIGAARGISAFTALRVDTRTGIPDSLRIDSLTLHYSKSRVWTEPSISAVLFRIREIPDSVIWSDDALLPGLFPTQDSYPIVDSLLVNVSSGSTDTVLNWSVPQPQAAWNRWHTDSTGGGYLIEPITPGAIVEFYTRDDPSFTPKVLVHGAAYLPSDSAWHDTTLIALIGGDGYLVLDSAARRPERLFVSQGFAERMAIYFPVDSLLRDFSRSVNRAELTLYADTLDPADLRDPFQNIIIKHGQILTSAWFHNPDTLKVTGTLGQEFTMTGRADSTSTVFVMDVTPIVDSWISNPSANHGIQVFSAQALGGYIAREVFHSPLSEDPNKKPKLTIWFTEQSY
jgi:hypothetical protein